MNDVPSVLIKGLSCLLTVVLEGFVRAAKTRGLNRKNKERKIMDTKDACRRQGGSKRSEKYHLFYKPTV